VKLQLHCTSYMGALWGNVFNSNRQKGSQQSMRVLDDDTKEIILGAILGTFLAQSCADTGEILKRSSRKHCIWRIQGIELNMLRSSDSRSKP